MAFKFGQTNFGAGSFNSLFKNPYDFSVGRIDSDTSKAILEAVKKRNQEDEFGLVQERSLLDRTFDALQIGNYASANYASDWVKYAKGEGSFNKAFNAFDDIGQGLKAGNPFGDGSEEDEKTYSEVFGEAGWNPESMLGKFAKGTAGFVGDVLLDPTTYLSGGVSAVVKGSGRVGKTAESLATLKRSLPESIVGGKKVTHMTAEMAEHIIKKTGKKIEPDQLAMDSKALAEKYNKLLGIRDVDGGKPITFGVSNLPFGDKLASKMGVLGKTATLSSGKTVRSLADNIGTAELYSGLRNQIYGSQIGKLLSTTAPLKVLADRNPAELYDFMKFIDTTKGQKLNKLKSDKAIAEKAKDLLGLTPAQNKELLTLLEDKTIWSKVKGTMKFADTKKGEEFAKAIAKGAEGQDELVGEAEQIRNVFDGVKQNESLTKAEKDALEEMRNQIVPDDVKYKERIEANKGRIAKLKQAREELLRAQKPVSTVKEKPVSPTPVKDMGVPKSKVKEPKSTKSFKQAEVEESIHFDTVKTGEKFHKILEDAKSERASFDGEREMGAIMREHGVSDRGLRENGTRLKSRSKLRIGLNKFIYEGKGSLPTDFRDGAMEQIVDMMRHADDGEKLLGLLKHEKSFFGKLMPKELSDAMDKISNDGLPEMIREHIENHPQLFSEHAKEVHTYLGAKHHYTKISDIREPILELKKKAKLTTAEQAKLKNLQARLVARDLDYNKFFKGMSYDEFMEMRKTEKAQAHGEQLEEMYGLDEAVDGVEALPHKVQFSPDEHKALISAVSDNFKKSLLINHDAKTGAKVQSKGGKRATKKRLEHRQAHEETAITTMKELFPTLKFTEMTTAQRNLWLRVSNGMAWDKVLNPTKESQMLEDAKRILARETKKRKEVQRLSTLAEDAKFGKRISFKQGDEVIDATIIRIEPNKVEHTRTESDPDGQVTRVKEEYEGKNGKKLYREVSKQPTRDVKYMAEDGTNSYIVRMEDGTEKSVNLDSIVHVSSDKARTFDELIEEVEIIKEKKIETEKLIESFNHNKAQKLARLKEEDARMAKVNAKNQARIADGKADRQRLVEITRLEKELAREEKALAGRETRYKKKQDKLYDEFVTRVGTQAERVMELEDMNVQANKALADLATALSQKIGKDVDVNDIDGTIEHINVKKKEMQEALESDEALEMYIRNNVKDGRFIVEDAKYQESAEIALTERASSERMANNVKWLRGEFNKAGVDEVGIGKLTEEQFLQMKDRYVPHIPTEDGARYFDSMKELKEHRAGLTQDLGYGVKWNPFRSSRTIKGENIEAINKHFADKLKGKNLFSENMSEIYVTRMIKHNELMYDNEYMKTMMNDFGHEIGEDGAIRKGYKAVANFGQVKELVQKIAKQKYKGMMQSGQEFAEHEMAGLYERALNESFAELKISRETLDAKGTPMLELSSEQIKALRPHGITKQVNDAIVTKANQARKLAIARDEKDILKMYDKFTHFIKLMQTTIMPSFHIRNKFSNDFQNYLAVGKEAFDPRLQATALKASLAGNDLDKLKALPPIVTKDGKRVYHYDEIIDLAKVHGALDDGFFASDLGANSMTSGIGKKFVSPKWNPTDTGNFIGYRVGTKVGTVTENTARLTQFAILLKNGSTPQQAGESVTKYLFDYSDLTQFEVSVMKRIFPYYTWMRKNSRLQVSELIEQTEKYAMLPKIENGIEGMNNEEDRISETYTSDFARDWIQTPFMNKSTEVLADGTVKERKEPLLLSPNLPYMDLARLPDVANPLDSLREFFSQTNPAIKLPVELKMNKDFFFDSEISKTDKEGLEEAPIKDRLKHIAKQLAPVNAFNGANKADNTDAGLSILNTLGGVKVSSFDYEKSKQMMIVDAIKSGKGIKGQDGFYTKLLKGAGRAFEVGKGHMVTSFYNKTKQEPAKYKIQEGDLVEFEKRKAIANKQIKAKYGAFEGDSKLQWSLMEGKEDFEMATVKKVIDGDTFLAVNEKGKEVKVRVLLMDTPETVDKRKNYKMPVGKEASGNAKKELGNKQVILFKDSVGDETDTYGRSLFYVHTTNGDYAKNAIKKGYARTFYEEDQDRLEEYRKAQEGASKKKKGIWNFEGYPNIEEDYFNSDVPSVREWQKQNK